MSRWGKSTWLEVTRQISVYPSFIPTTAHTASLSRLALFISRFSAVQKHTVEFNQLAMANSEGSEAMLNRVMTKDNIGVAVLLEVRKEMMEVSCE